MNGCVLFSSIDVAYAIAQGDPPEWLVRGLEVPHIGIDKEGRAIMPDISREDCEAVVIEAWRRFHGRVERSHELYEACKMYWGVCGGTEFEPFDDWHPDGDYSWVRDIIERYRG
jgi:hypothetical protein